MLKAASYDNIIMIMLIWPHTLKHDVDTYCAALTRTLNIGLDSLQLHAMGECVFMLTHSLEISSSVFCLGSVWNDRSLSCCIHSP